MLVWLVSELLQRHLYESVSQALAARMCASLQLLIQAGSAAGLDRDRRWIKLRLPMGMRSTNTLQLLNVLPMCALQVKSYWFWVMLLHMPIRLVRLAGCLGY